MIISCNLCKSDADRVRATGRWAQNERGRERKRAQWEGTEKRVREGQRDGESQRADGDELFAKNKKTT